MTVGVVTSICFIYFSITKIQVDSGNNNLIGFGSASASGLECVWDEAKQEWTFMGREEEEETDASMLLTADLPAIPAVIPSREEISTQIGGVDGDILDLDRWF